MPKRKTVTVEEVDASEQYPSSSRDISEFLEGLVGSTRTIKLFRVTGTRQKWLTTVSDPKVISEETILEQFGPGRYAVRAQDTNGKWTPQHGFDIEGPEGSSQTPIILPSSDNGSAQQMFQIQIQMMQEQAQRTHEMMLAMIQNMSGGNRGPSVTDLVQGLAGIKALDGGNGNKLEEMKTMIEFARELGGNGDHGPKGTVEAILDTAGKFLPAIMAARGIQGTTQPSEQPGWTPGSERTAEPPALPSVSQDRVAIPDETQKGIRQLWQRIENAAKKDMDPERLAGTLMDLEELDDLAASTIIDSIEKTASFEDWQKVTGPLPDNLKPWFGRFYLAVKEELKDPNPENERYLEEAKKGGNDATGNDTPKP